MKNLLHPFQEKDGEFSWRKAMTALVTFVFVFSVMGYEIAHNFEELPTNYQIIIGGVFGFYFSKNAFKGISLKKDV